MTSPTTPRDAIGLSERLLQHAEFGEVGPWADDGKLLLKEAATQLDALHKELAQTQAHLAIRNGDLAEAVRERDSLQERVKELEDDNLRLHSDKMDQFERAITAESSATRAEQERDTLSRVMEDTANELACATDNEAILEAIARLRQERDEALERLKPFSEAAEDLPDTHKDHSDIWEAPCAGQITAGELRAARDLVLRLASGPDKEKRE